VFSFAKPQDNAFLYSDKATVFNKYEYIFGQKLSNAIFSI